MTTPNVQEMAAGRELDALVAEKVMGWDSMMRNRTTRDDDGFIGRSPNGAILRAPHYSTDIAAAWLIVEKMRADGYFLQLHWEGEKSQQWVADFVEEIADDFTGEQLGDAAPLAICRAALAARTVAA